MPTFCSAITIPHDSRVGRSGSMKPRPVRRWIARSASLGLAAAMAALGVVEMVDENMANAAHVHAIESGKAYEGRTLIAFGGGGPVHACRVAEKVGIERILVPSGAGVGGAIGFFRRPGRLRGCPQSLSALRRSISSRSTSFSLRWSERRPPSCRKAASGRRSTQVADRLHALTWARDTRSRSRSPFAPLKGDDVAALCAAYDVQYTKFYDRPVPARMSRS